MSHELVGLDQRASGPGLAHCSADLVGELIAQAGRFGSELLAPLNAPGDRQCAHGHDTRVATPDGFAEPYRHYAAAGWQGLSCGTAWGGQGLPKRVDAVGQEIWQASNQALSMGQALTMRAIEVLIASSSARQRDLLQCHDKAATRAAVNAAGTALAQGIEQLASTLDPVLAAPRGDHGPAVGAVSFLHLVGLVSGGWMLAQSALTAAAPVAHGSTASFYRAKIISARFFCDDVLVQAARHARIV